VTVDAPKTPKLVAEPRLGAVEAETATIAAHIVTAMAQQCRVRGNTAIAGEGESRTNHLNYFLISSKITINDIW